MSTENWQGHPNEGDGWVTHRDDDGEFAFSLWCHEPSNRCVSVHWTARRSWVGAVWGAEPADKATAVGYAVTCRIHDELGNPIDGEGFWVESLALALKLGAKYRSAVLGERYQPSGAIQLTLDDALPEVG